MASSPSVGKPEPSAMRQVLLEHARAAYRTAILDAAVRIIVRVGHFDLKMGELAAEAGVSVGTLYNYFANKDEVTSALEQRETDELRARLATVRDEPDPLLRLGRTIAELFAFLDDHAELFAVYTRMLHDAESQGLACTERKAGHTHFRALIVEDLAAAVVAGRIRVDLAPDELGAMLGALISGCIFDWARRGRTTSMGRAASPLLDLFLYGVAKP